jgi:hypothetical protein
MDYKRRSEIEEIAKQKEAEIAKYIVSLPEEERQQFLKDAEAEKAEKAEKAKIEAEKMEERSRSIKNGRKVSEMIQENKAKNLYKEKLDETDKKFVTDFMKISYKIVDQTKENPFKLDEIYYIIDKNNKNRYVPIRKKCIKINGKKICTLCNNDAKNPNDNTNGCIEIDATKREVWEKTGLGSLTGKSATTYDPPRLETLEQMMNMWKKDYRMNTSQARDQLQDPLLGPLGGKTKRKQRKSKRKQRKSKRKGKCSKKHKTHRHSKK